MNSSNKVFRLHWSTAGSTRKMWLPACVPFIVEYLNCVWTSTKHQPDVSLVMQHSHPSTQTVKHSFDWASIQQHKQRYQWIAAFELRWRCRSHIQQSISISTILEFSFIHIQFNFFRACIVCSTCFPPSFNQPAWTERYRIFGTDRISNRSE